MERELYRNTKFELAYVGNRGIHLLNYTDANLVPAADRLAFALTNANALRPFGAGNWGTINRAFWGGDSNYHALQALFRTRVKAIDAQFAYTWGRSLSDTDVTNSGNVNQGSLLVDPSNPRLNYGPSSINRPHIFTATSSMISLPCEVRTAFCERLPGHGRPLPFSAMPAARPSQLTALGQLPTHRVELTASEAARITSGPTSWPVNPVEPAVRAFPRIKS